MQGKMKSVYGIYKKHGREEFLQAAKEYSDHVSDTIEDTISEMESRWCDEAHTMTEAEKMVADYNRGESPLLREKSPAMIIPIRPFTAICDVLHSLSEQCGILSFSSRTA